MKSMQSVSRIGRRLLAVSRKVAFVCVIGGMVLFFSLPQTEGVFHSFDNLFFDVVEKNLVQAPGHEVVVINIDDRSIEAMGREAVFSYATFADLLNKLDQADSVVLGLNLLRPDKDFNLLAQSMVRNGKTVISMPVRRRDESQAMDLPAMLIAAAAGVGQREIFLREGQVLGGLRAYLPWADSCFPHVVLEALRVAGRMEVDIRPTSCLPATNQGDDWLMALPMKLESPQYSLLDVLRGRVPTEAFKGKIVFIGHQGYEQVNQLLPNRLAEAGNAMTWTQADAMLTQALLDGGHIHRLPYVVQWLVSFLVLLSMARICRRAGLPALYSLLAWWLAACMLMSAALLYARYWVPLGAPLFGSVLIYSAFSWRRLAQMHEVLRQEMAAMREVFFQGRDGAAKSAQDAEDFLLTDMIQHMRAWQHSYVSVLNMLPHPILLEQNDEILLANQAARALLAEQGEEAMLDLSRKMRRDARLSGYVATERVSVQGQQMVLLVTPFEGCIDGSPVNLVSLLELEERNQAVSGDKRVLRQVAHDLRSPLTTVLTLLERRAGTECKKSVDVLLDDVRQLVNYSLRASQDFMLLTRAEHLQAKDFLPVSLQDLLEDVSDQLALLARPKGMRVVTAPAGGPVLWVSGHYDMLLRAAINIADNAVKYSPEGSCIQLRLTERNGLGCLEIEDEGIGIPPESVPSLFEPFVQLAREPRDGRSGVGLGLPFVQTVLTTHGGEVEVSSVRGCGSTFRLILPLMTAAQLDALVYGDDLAA